MGIVFLPHFVLFTPEQVAGRQRSALCRTRNARDAQSPYTFLTPRPFVQQALKRTGWSHGFDHLRGLPICSARPSCVCLTRLPLNLVLNEQDKVLLSDFPALAGRVAGTFSFADRSVYYTHIHSHLLNEVILSDSEFIAFLSRF